MRITLISFGKCFGKVPCWYFDILTFQFNLIYKISGDIYPLFSIGKQYGKITLKCLFFIKMKYGTK